MGGKRALSTDETPETCDKEAFSHIFASFLPIYQISHIIGLDSIPTFHNFLIESQIIQYSVWSLQALTGP